MLQMVVLWRRDMSQIKYEWLEKTPFDINFNSFQSKEDLINSTMSKIDLAIQKLLKPTEALTYEVIVQVCNLNTKLFTFSFMKCMFFFFVISLNNYRIYLMNTAKVF